MSSAIWGDREHQVLNFGVENASLGSKMLFWGHAPTSVLPHGFPEAEAPQVPQP